MSRRSAGDGSVYETADGSGWMYSLNVPASPSRKRRRIRGRARTKTEALAKLRAAQRELRENGGQDADRRRLVSRSIDDYLKVRAAEPLGQGTRDQDRWTAALIRTGLGSYRLDALSVEDCDGFLEAVASGAFGKPLARPQLRRVRRWLYRAIENDRRRGLVARNVADLVILPQESADVVGRRPARALTLVELRGLLDASAGAVVLLIDLSGRNGLRPAEARGLKWSSVDLGQGTLSVDGQIDRRNLVVQPKTHRSRRTIRIDKVTVDLLSEWQDSQARHAFEAGVAWGNEQGLVITTRHGTPVNQRNVHRSLVNASKAAGISPAAASYDLRHTAITHQVERRVPVHKIADWAGTSERMIWDVYRQKLEEVSDVAPIDLGEVTDPPPSRAAP